jgi:soluble lytic murein transglycosylase
MMRRSWERISASSGLFPETGSWDSAASVLVVRSRLNSWLISPAAFLMCVIFSVMPCAASARPRPFPQEPAASQASENSAAEKASAEKPQAETPAVASSPAAPAPRSEPTTPTSQAAPQATPAPDSAPVPKKVAGGKTAAVKKKSATPGKAQTAAARRKSKTVSPRVKRMRQAFMASASLRPMAQQLLQNRTPPAYAGVEAYARAHAKEDAGALAWLVVGYAHVLDHDYFKAVDPLNRAKPHAGDLGDYTAYYLGTAYLQTGRNAEAAAALADFNTNYPDSLLVRDAHVVYASALLSEGRPADAAALLEKDRRPARADVELALGRAYAAAAQPAKAAEALNNVFYNMPASPEADPASTELRRLSGVPQATLAQRKTRADLLLKAKRYPEAISELTGLLNDLNEAERLSSQLALADAMRRSGRGREAKQALNSLSGTSGENNAQRLFLLGEIARASDDDDGFFHDLDELRAAGPASPWLEQALLSAANLRLIRHDYDKAIDAFRELQQRFPNGQRASYAHWKAAWLTSRSGRNQDAKAQFEEQIALYPGGLETPAALYWRARLAEEDNDAAMARAYYQKLSDRYRNYYYAELGRQRLKHLPATANPEHYALLDRVPPMDSSGKVQESEPPVDDLHLQKAELLSNGGLLDFAVREVQAAAAANGGTWGPAETAQIYEDSGRYDRAIEVMKHSAPGYFALDIPDLPRAYWEALFPKPYWSELKRSAAANGLDPFLVASLIRQESEFNPEAVSHANAVGLMQLLPKTGTAVARQVQLKRYSANQLFTPAVNLQLGTRYFKGMVDKFGGSSEYALAAYNAGSERVEEWMGQGKYRDPQEFVESIPFTETREYVQAILRNASVYKQIYGEP